MWFCRRDEWQIINQKTWFRPLGRNKIGEMPYALGTGIVNFKGFLYDVPPCSRGASLYQFLFFLPLIRNKISGCIAPCNAKLNIAIAIKSSRTSDAASFDNV